MPRVEPYFNFLQRVESFDEAEFLQKVTCRYLYFPDLPELESGDVFTTVQFKPSEIMARGAEATAGQGVIPVEKDASSNAFAMMITMGRAANNDLLIPDRRVSKFHAYFRLLGTRWMLTDANSTNGTMVNGVTVAPERSVEIRSEAVIELAGMRAQFLLPQELYAQIQGDRVRIR